MKTLADLCKENGILSYAKLCDPPIPCYEGTAKQWESVVQAVRKAVIEECAKVCDEQAALPECPERATYCAEAIRALKDKK